VYPHRSARYGSGRFGRVLTSIKSGVTRLAYTAQTRNSLALQLFNFMNKRLEQGAVRPNHLPGRSNYSSDLLFARDHIEILASRLGLDNMDGLTRWPRRISAEHENIPEFFIPYLGRYYIIAAVRDLTLSVFSCKLVAVIYGTRSVARRLKRISDLPLAFPLLQ
jgi:hypothetical protein